MRSSSQGEPTGWLGLAGWPRLRRIQALLSLRGRPKEKKKRREGDKRRDKAGMMLDGGFTEGVGVEPRRELGSVGD